MSMERGKTRWSSIERVDSGALRHHCIQAVEAETVDGRNCQTEKPSSSPSTTNQVVVRSIDRSGANACFLSREETHRCEEMISAFGSVLIRRSSQPFFDLQKSTSTFGI